MEDEYYDESDDSSYCCYEYGPDVYCEVWEDELCGEEGEEADNAVDREADESFEDEDCDEHEYDKNCEYRKLYCYHKGFMCALLLSVVVVFIQHIFI